MKNVKSIKLIFVIAIFLNFGSFMYAQVGINTEDPTAALDINGELRIRHAEISTSTDDYNLVIDTLGNVKRTIVSNSFFRGYLSNDFVASTDPSAISKIENFTVIDSYISDFVPSTNLFIPSVSGLFNITITLSVTLLPNSQVTLNIVSGLVDNATNKWVMRFSTPTDYISSMGENSTSGVTNTFSGAVKLQKGKEYYFGITGTSKILSNPTGASGEGIGTFFSVEFLKRIE